MQKQSGLFIFFLFVICVISCRKEPKHPSWDIDVLAPLVKSTLTINNIIPDSILQQNSNNSLDIIYKYNLSSFSIDSLFKIPDTTIRNIYAAPLSYTVQPGGPITPVISTIVNYAFGDAQLTHVTLRNGKMFLKIKSQIKGLVDFTYTIPKMTNPYGQVFDTTVTIPAATTTADGMYSGVFDLSGYKIDLTGPSGTSVNTLVMSYSAVSAHQSPVAIAVGDMVDLENTFVDVFPGYAKGYLGNSVTNVGPDSTDYTLFKNIIDGTLSLENINIGLSIVNSIGADARITMNNLSSINSRTGSMVPLSHSIIGMPVNINRSTDNFGAVTPSTYNVFFTTSNSNINDFVENFPDKLSYQFDLEINPMGNISGSNDFVYWDKLMKTEMNMTIPLSLVANDLTLADTIDFNLTDTAKNVNSGNLYLFIDNGFPFSAEAQLYLMDDNLNIVDSLISMPNTIQAPQLDVNYICVGQRSTKLTIPLNSNKLDLLRAAKKMYMKMKFNTVGQPNFVKIYSFYKMDVKVVGDFNYTVIK